MYSSPHYFYNSVFQEKRPEDPTVDFRIPNLDSCLLESGHFLDTGSFSGMILPSQPDFRAKINYRSPELSISDPNSPEYWKYICDKASRVKQLALQCDAYRLYRDKNKGEVACNNSSLRVHGFLKWPDVLEDAFWRACVRFPPCDRLKHRWQDSQVKYGRNQLISKSIEQETGIDLENDRKGDGPRKIISSHIQVIIRQLKRTQTPPFEGKKEVLAHLIGGNSGEQRRGSRAPQRETRQRDRKRILSRKDSQQSREMIPYYLENSQSFSSTEYYFHQRQPNIDILAYNTASEGNAPEITADSSSREQNNLPLENNFFESYNFRLDSEQDRITQLINPVFTWSYTSN